MLRHHIFLSYSRRNVSIMRRIRDDLRSEGLIVWTDEGIEPGSISWKEAIESAIRHTDMVVVLLSPSANDSRWVQREIDYAEVHHKPIIPLLIAGDVRSAIPFALAGSQFIDMRQHYAIQFKKLTQRCFEYLPINTLPTLPARFATTTIMSSRNRQKRKRIHIKRLIATSSLVILAILFVLIAFQLQSSEAEAIQPDLSPNIELIYNHETLVVHNITDDVIVLDDLQFHQDNTNLVFHANSWVNQTLRDGRCAQVWDDAFAYLPPHRAPADACISRVAYRATSDSFWISQLDLATFTIRRDDELIATCPTTTLTNTAIHRCRIKI